MAKSAILSVRIVGDSRNAVIHMKKTSAAVAGLQRAGASARSMTAGIFATVTRLSFMASVFGSLAAVALSSVGSILSLGGALASILPVALMLPGLLAGVGIAGGVLIAALKDAGAYLGDLAPQFSALQDSISGAFWERAAAPIREMVTTLLPAVTGGLTRVATEMGGWAVAFSGAISSAEGIADIQGMINRTADAVNIAGDGVGMFTSALLLLGNIGSVYLPALAGGFNTLADSFLTWLTAAYESGNVFEWIDTGLQGLALLGSSIMSLVGIFAGLTRAANEAGATGLVGFAGGLAAIDRAVNSPAFQGALIEVFRGANTAVAALGPGLGALGGAFIALAPTIGAILPLATSGFAAILTGVGQLLSHPAVAGGLLAAFEGINTGLTALGGVFQTLAPLAGAALTLFGGLASGVLPLLAQVITAIAPPITAVVTAIANWVAANPGLTAAIIAIVGALGALVPVITGIVGFVGTLTAAWAAVTAAVAPALTAFGGIVAIFDLLGISLASVMLPVAGIVAGVGLLAAAFGYALATSEPFRAALASLGTAIMGLVQPIIGAVMPALQQMGSAFMSLLSTVMGALTPMLTSIVSFAAALISALQPVFNFIGAVLAPVFTFLADTVSAAFTWIGSIISAAAAFITSIFTTLTAVLRGDWSAAWEGIKSIVSTGIELVKSVFSGGIDFLKSVGSAGLEALKGIFSAVWEAIKGIVSAGWETIKSFFTTGIEAIKTAASTGLDAVVSFFRDLPGKVVSALSGFAQKMITVGGQVIQGLIDGIKGAAGRAIEAVQGVVGSAIDGAKALLGIKSPSRVFKKIGQYTAQGLAIGVNNMAPRAVGSVMNLARKVTKAGQGIDLGTPTLGFSASAPAPAPDMQGRKTSAATGQTVINLTVNGAIDKLGTVREIRQMFKEVDLLLGDA